MAQRQFVSPERKTLFGAAETPKPVKKPVTLQEQISDRLVEKYQNYERAAMRLDLRGEHDAAEVLKKAAARLRLIRNTGADAEEDLF
ncbi:hypothetical protein PUV54_06135 [Hyphococcus flavus]|uniref:Uncharacterized protein n=1 Tax=Hyphococcus flavus TaxID=1866326 RepID=A0AAF0CGR6_9PROT|nr:hypothetical protein [Hyphococcus flavus]WDI32774.1 hypothetical protein PUV54_06135 [Hyphococcus flavus]